MIGGLVTLILSLSGGITAAGIAGASVWGSLLILWKVKWALGVIIGITLLDFFIAKYFIGMAFVSLVMPEIPSAISCVFVTLDVQPCLAAVASAYTFKVIRFILTAALSVAK